MSYSRLGNRLQRNELDSADLFCISRERRNSCSLHTVTRLLYRLLSAALRGGLSNCVHAGAVFAGLFLLHALPIRAQQSTDWMTSLRKEIGAHHLTAALEIANQRVATAPDDTDARGWRARTLAWLGNLQEAE
ncbi:MAG: hypothetical protein JWN92_1191, partial [Candidatus Acidoferrum typicum]|nr:hypothetical protein [Candidatus Acidoferrum typicum]